MDSQQRFDKGLHTDNDRQYQPTDSYRDARNWVYRLDGSLQQATSPLPICSIPLPVRGQVSLGEEEILFLSDGKTVEIGVVRQAAYSTVLRSTELSFSQRNYLSAVARTDYQGHRIVYFADGENPIRRLDLDAPLPANLSQGLRLFTTPGAPAIALKEVQDAGSLSSGIVFAGVRLLTESKNATPFSLLTAPIPLTDDSLLSGDYDGAPLGSPTTKSILFSITDIAAGYPFAEVVVARYTGTANQLSLHTLPLAAIDGRDTLEVLYYSESQHQETVSLNELLSEYADQEIATLLHQKDNVLLAAGVSSPAKQIIPWQKIANSIILDTVVQEEFVAESVLPIHYSEQSKTGGADVGQANAQLSGYQKPELFAKKSLQRSEVYSFCLIPIYDNQRLDAYHIPAPYFQGSRIEPFRSTLLYPSNADYPQEQGIGRTQVRHHKMPSLAAEPLVRTVDGGYYLRILGVTPVVGPDLSLLTEEQKKKFGGWLLGVQLRTDQDKSILAQGIAQQLMDSGGQLTPTPFSGAYPYQSANYSGSIARDLFAFYSPETTILQKDVAAASILSAEAELAGTAYGIADKRTGVRKEKYAHSFLHYTSLEYTPRQQAELTASSTRYVTIAGGDQPLQLGEDKPFSTREQNGYLLLKLKAGASPPAYTGPGEILYDERSGTDVLSFRQKNGQLLDQDRAFYTGATRRFLYNLSVARPAQYGALEQATYIPMGKALPAEPNPVFFPGDVFIGKVGIISTTAERQGSGDIGLQFRTLNYFFCESTLNPAYRHYLPTATGQQSATVPYYPKVKRLWQENGTGLLQLPPDKGHATGYNKQYSFQNTLQPFRLADKSTTQVSAFPNRILYSATAVEGEQLDAFRIFLANNYHDLPKHKGVITDMFTLENSLHVHTEQSLWKSFFNEASTQTTSEGEIYLGNGGLFPRPSVELLTLDGGYAGTRHRLASVTTPMGRFFVSAQQKKVFLYNGSLTEISKVGLYSYFLHNMQSAAPYLGCYDAVQQRYLLSGLPDNTLSFSLRTGTWTSFHDLAPSFCYTSSRAVLCSPTTLSLPEGGSAMPSSLTLITNSQPDASKLFTNLILQGTLPQKMAQGTEEQSTQEHTLTQLTEYGQEPLPGEVLVRRASHQHQLPCLRDEQEGRLKGKWLQTKLSYPARIGTLLSLFTTVLRAFIR